MKPVNVGICGLGTVGSGTFNVLTRNNKDINAKAGREIKITHIGARRTREDCDLTGVTVSNDIFAVVNDPNVDILVELIGGTTVAKDLVLQAVRNGKHVVTANKALIAEYGNELFAEAVSNNVTISYEAAVAGGIPIIRSLREGLAANKVEWLAGIINGTGNFILTEMRDKGRQFDDVLKEAQALGYAEADPTFDVEGIDAAHKLVILASIAFGMPLQFDKVFTEGISQIRPEDVAYADELGYRIKHLGITRRLPGKGIELRVHPTMIPQSRLLANVNGVMNAVVVKGDAVGPTLYYGAGAGAEPTASAVISDIVHVSRMVNSSYVSEDATAVPHLGYGEDHLHDYTILPIEEIESAYYLRLSALDQPGVLSRVTQIFSEAGISIEALIQKEPKEGQEHVSVILLTNRTIEKQVNKAIEQIESLSPIQGNVVRIRVESLK
ncbi:homoserine dehydrogenase [Teredinibacter turnerae]|uniref:Homoserine dehydrogenase n=1 Tax=Teredinibacter turnerae (strain ATCC 39867 / T7901) TaxID=377629 RepID=C5BR78_TERTT|nr:homoserine dehydrogenase [Teredinibacter turnerae]ACR11096.1 homoserine dehydrogenase [Teredinibacter turnerae T7901]